MIDSDRTMKLAVEALVRHGVAGSEAEKFCAAQPLNSLMTASLQQARLDGPPAALAIFRARIVTLYESRV